MKQEKTIQKTGGLTTDRENKTQKSIRNSYVLVTLNT